MLSRLNCQQINRIDQMEFGMWRLILLSLLSAQCCLHAAELISEVKNLKGNVEQCLQIVKNTKDDVTARTAFGLLAEDKSEVSQAKLSCALELIRRPGQFEKAACIIALSPQQKAWCEGLYAARGGQELAAAAQAAIALMNMIGSEKQARIAKLPMKNNPGGKKHKNRWTNASLGGSINLDLVLKMLQSRSSRVREYAMIAAAYQPSPQLDAKVFGIEAKKGLIPALKLLYKANAKKEITLDEFKNVFDKKSGGEIRSPGIDMMYKVFLLPSHGPACEAAGIRGNADVLKYIHESLLKHKDLRVQIEAAKAIGRIGSQDSLPILIEKIQERRKHWPVMIQVLDSIGAIPDKQSVQPLIDMYEKEKGRLRLDVAFALCSIAGEKKTFLTYKHWQEWWDKVKDDFQVDMNKTLQFRQTHLPIDLHVPSNGEFYGLPIFSDRICFVVDTSLSMKGGKIENLRENAITTIESLNDAVYFNQVDFGGQIKIHYGGDLMQDKRSLIEYIKVMPMSWGTRSLDSIEVGMEINPVDTIYFLSDGAPIQSQITSWDGIHPSIDLTNRYRPIAVFCVSFSAGKSNARQMEKLSRSNAGKSVDIE